MELLGSVTTLSEYIKLIASSGNDDVLFRGQNIDQPLIPRIGRPATLFRGGDIRVNEHQMLMDFKRRSLPYLDARPATDLEWLALAQHHRLPTRLLDWTKNALAALWFAVDQNRGNDGVVWILSINKNDLISLDDSKKPFEVKRTKIFQPDHITKRIIAQNGWFTVHKYMDSGKFIHLGVNTLFTKKLKKITIPAEAFELLCSELEVCGINASTMFPDFEGLSAHISQLYIKRPHKIKSHPLKEMAKRVKNPYTEALANPVN